MKIAVLGTGRLGAPIVERLLACGEQVLAWNRTAEKAMSLRPLGVTGTEHPADAIREAAVTLTVLSDESAIRQVLFSKPATSALRGKCIIQMGTIAPNESRALSESCRQVGADYLEAPVLGSIGEARAGTLLVMVGGTVEQFARWRPLLSRLSREPRHIGPVGQAAALKLALNQLIAAEITAFSLSLGLVQRSGIPIDTFMDVLKSSALFAPAFEKKLPRLLARDYANPNFSTRHLLKDVELVFRETQALGLETAALAALRPLLERTVAAGHAGSDYSAIFEVITPPPAGS